MKSRFFYLLFLIIILFACKTTNPKIAIKTELGDIIVELYESEAPKTVENFLKYVDNNHYENSDFYRVLTQNNQPEDSIKLELIQGGIWKEQDLFEPVKHENTNETGIKHLDGTISMARAEPNTARDDFFICVGNQPELDYGGKRNSDGQGFAAFGKVVQGMDIVKSIQKKSTEGQYLNPRIVILNIERI